MVVLEGPLGGVPAGPFSWSGGTHSGPKNHGISGQTFRASYSQPKLDGTGGMYHVVCGHQVTYRGPTQTRLVPVQGTCTTPDQI